MRAPPCSWVYFSTSISPIRYRSFANNCVASAFDYCTTSSSFSHSLFFSLFVPRCSLPLFHAFIAAAMPSYTCVSFLCPPPPSCYHRENLFLLLSRPFFFTFSFHLSFPVPLLISLDRIDLFMCTAAITISNPDLFFFVRPFLPSLKTNVLIVEPCPAVRACLCLNTSTEYRVKCTASIFLPCRLCRHVCVSKQILFFTLATLRNHTFVLSNKRFQEINCRKSQS